MYKIIDNAGNLFEKSFNSDQEAVSYISIHFVDYISSVLSSDPVSLADPDGYYLCNVNTATGEVY